MSAELTVSRQNGLTEQNDKVPCKGEQEGGVIGLAIDVEGKLCSGQTVDCIREDMQNAEREKRACKQLREDGFRLHKHSDATNQKSSKKSQS